MTALQEKGPKRPKPKMVIAHLLEADIYEHIFIVDYCYAFVPNSQIPHGLVKESDLD